MLAPAIFQCGTEKPQSGMDTSVASMSMLTRLQVIARNKLASVTNHLQGMKVKKEYTKPAVTKRDVLKNVAAAAQQPTSGIIPPQPSDVRLKRDIHAIDRLANGLMVYRFRYLWSDVEMVGVMAQDVLEVMPEAVVLGAEGFYSVDYGRLDLRCTTYAEWCAKRPLADAA